MVNLRDDEFSVKEDYYRKYGENELRTYKMEKRKMSRIGLSQFVTKFEGIPDGRIEWFLWERAKCIVWEHPILGLIVTDFSEVGWDIDGWPNKWKPVFETNIEGLTLPDFLTLENAVVFYDCLDFRYGRRDCLSWIPDIVDVTETMRTQVFNQKTPMVAIVGDSRLKQKIGEMFRKIADNARMLFIDKSMKDTIETFDINPPFNVTELWQYRKALENDMMEFIGNDSQDAFQKKERLIVDEQEGNDETLNYLLADCLKAREKAVEHAKELGYNASTRIQDNVRPLKSLHSSIDEQGAEDGFRND